MNLIATCGGYQLHEDGSRLVFINRSTGCLGVAVYVAGLIGLIFGVNGVVWLPKGNVALGGAFLTVSALAIGAAVLMWKRARKTESGPPTAADILVIVDREKLVVTDADGRVLGPLVGASFRSVFQLASSSRALELAYSGGSVVVARGSPFTGGIEGIAGALGARGLRVS